MIDPADQAIDTIKRHMPAVLAEVRSKAAMIGSDAYKLVRRGARGEPGCFYACEAGRVVGTPFADLEVPTSVAQLVAHFGMSMLVAWPASAVDASEPAAQPTPDAREPRPGSFRAYMEKVHADDRALGHVRLMRRASDGAH